MTTIWRRAGFLRFFIVCILAVSFLSTAACAGEEFISGTPVLSASLEGVNEYSPGEDAVLMVILENRGLNEFKITKAALVSPGEEPSTAKLVNVGLEPGNAPIVVKSDPQMVGDIPAGSRVRVPFDVKIDQYASGGVFTLPLALEYTHLSSSEQIGYDTLIYHYDTVNVKIPLQVKVKSKVIIEVGEVRSENLTAGNEGYISMRVRNIGSLPGNESVARIMRNGESLAIPVEGSVFLGNFPTGEEVSCRFKVRVDEQAQASAYPLDVVVESRDAAGDVLTSEPVTIGITVMGKTDFSMISDGISIPRGGSKEIEIIYRNCGPVTVYSAQARLSAVEPFTAVRDTAYLGDMEPGQEASARFVVAVDRSATPKEYGVDSEIRFRDALGNNLISATMTVPVQVYSSTGIDAVISSPVMMSMVFAALVGVGYYAYIRKRRRN